jgi:signal transduction histidine kinase
MTERDRIEDKLRQSEKLESIGLLAGGIAHDFNNLLTGFFGFIQLARMNAGEPEKVVMYLDHAVGPFQRARSLTQQLLTFAKGGEPVRRPLVLSEVLVDVLRFSLGGSAVSWDLRVTPGTSRILANESQVHQVYENLSLNAKQALGEAGGALSVTLRDIPHPGPEGRGLEPRDYVESVVEDNGPGIPSEVLPKVFDPFFTTKTSGTGLGLSICFSLVKNHGGAIEAESMPGQGTRFRLFWPAEVTRSPEA